MKLAFLADTHVANHRQFGGPLVAGLNVRARIAVAALARAARIAATHGCQRLVVLGDLFDSPRPSPPLVRAVGAALQLAGCPVPVIVGNHDRASDAEYDNAASPLGLINGIDVIEKPVKDGGLLLVPFMPGAAMDWLPEVMKAFSKHTGSERGRRVLGLHLGIWDDDTPPYLRGAKDAVSIGLVRQLMREYGIGSVFAGNWHTRRTWSSGEGFVAIAGSTIPVNFGDESADGAMFIVDATADSFSKTIIRIPGPRWKTITGIQAMLGLAQPPDDGDHLFVKVNCPLEDMPKARALRTRIEGACDRVSITIIPDTEPVKQQARDAAAIARSAESFEDAIAGYVGAFPVSEPGTVDGVTRRLMEYRRGAG